MQNLQKKHALLEADIASHQDRIDGVKIQCQQFQEAGHFDAENIAKKTDNLVARYGMLQVRAWVQTAEACDLASACVLAGTCV